MSKPSIQEIASAMTNPGIETDSPRIDPDTVQIPGYGRVTRDQAKREAIARMRMVADALDGGKNVPSHAIELTAAFMMACCQDV